MLQAITALSWAAVVFVAVDLLFVTTFTSRHGLRSSLWRTPASWDRERKHLQLLAHSEDHAIARTARVLIKLDLVAWLLMFPAVIFALICGGQLGGGIAAEHQIAGRT
jgi:hypothetical protein